MRRRLPALALLGALAGPAGLSAQAPPPTKSVPPGTPVTITVVPATPSAPPATITLLGRHGHVTPHRQAFSHTGGGNTDIAQPSPDTLVVTMMGVAVAGAHPCKPSLARLDFDLEQCFEVALDKPEDRKQLKLSLEARVIGLLRSHRCGHGSAEESGACATVTCGPQAVLTVCAPPHSVAGGKNLSVNCHDGPVSVPITPGKYALHQTFHLTTAHPRCVLPCKAASAELAPDPALDPLWISYWEPFHGAIKKDFGFQVILKVSAEEKKDEKKEGNAADRKEEKLPPPQP
jgi:hypothetical protein